MKEEYTHTLHISTPIVLQHLVPRSRLLQFLFLRQRTGKRKGQRCRKSTHPWSSGLAGIREKVSHVNGHGQHNAEVAVCNEQLSRLCLLYTLEN